MASSAPAPPELEVECRVRNGLGIMVLNRPRVLNSLNLNMVQSMSRQLDEWCRPGSGVHCVLIRGAGGKAFCAGGDVRAVVQSAMAGDYHSPDTFFEAEYTLNLQISRLPIPYVALIDGIVMGGGVGASIHGHFRIATERTLFAMPECGIGLFPDIGAAYVLTSLPGSLGTYLAVTGARLTGVTVKECGLATHYLPSSAIDQVESTLCALGPKQLGGFDSVAKALDQLQQAHGPLPQGELSTLLPLVNLHFGHRSLRGVLASLQQAHDRLETVPADQRSTADARAHTFVSSALQALRKGSPLSAAVSFELMQRAAHAPLSTCLDSDRAMVAKFVRGQGDFYEGVRATLIDKSTPPAWRYDHIDKVPEHVVEAFFEGGPFASRHGGASKL